MATHQLVATNSLGTHSATFYQSMPARRDDAFLLWLACNTEVKLSRDVAESNVLAMGHATDESAGSLADTVDLVFETLDDCFMH